MTLVAVLAILAAVTAPAAPAERAVVVDPATSTIAFTLDSTFHEVHGTMPMAGGTIRFDPATGAASGAIRADARGARTGNGKRDKTMHAEVLESERYPTIEFRVTRVEGKLVDPGHSDLRLVGVLNLHGADHPMTLDAAVESTGGKVRGDLRFTIPYVEWGMRDPSFLVVRAAKTVDVTLHVEGRWAEPGNAALAPGAPSPSPEAPQPAPALR
jgi:polyisoprenoid-binding protein YceI